MHDESSNLNNNKLNTFKKLSIIIFGLILIILVLYFLVPLILNINKNPTSAANTITIKPSFQLIQAQLSGNVTKINESTLTIKSSNNSIDSFNLSDKCTLANDITGEIINKSNISKKVSLNKDAIFTLQWENNNWEITSIRFMDSVAPPELSIEHTPFPSTKPSQTQ